jgi:hypothetical protein
MRARVRSARGPRIALVSATGGLRGDESTIRDELQSYLQLFDKSSVSEENT